MRKCSALVMFLAGYMFSSAVFSTSSAVSIKAEPDFVANNKGINVVYAPSRIGSLIDIEQADATYTKITTENADDRKSLLYIAPRAGANTELSPEEEADQQELRELFTTTVAHFPGEVGFALLDEHGLAFLYNDTSFALMSVLKFHLAYATQARMRERQEDVSSSLNMYQTKLHNNTHSPLYDLLYKGIEQEGFKPQLKLTEDENKHQYVKISLADLLYYTTGLSDNNTCDFLLFDYVGGPEKFEAFLREKGLSNTKIRTGELAISSDVSKSILNSSTPYDAVKIFARYLADRSVNVETRALIDFAMYFNPSGKKRIAAGIKQSLAEGGDSAAQSLKLYNKTGMSDMTTQGLRVAVNDLAYFEYQGKPYVMAVFVKNVKAARDESVAKSELLIRELSKAVFSHFRKTQD